jgi:hypothetical protein
MRLEPVHRIIHKADHWPIKKRWEYLRAAYAAEKGRERRKRIHAALVPLTARVLKQEMKEARRGLVY